MKYLLLVLILAACSGEVVPPVPDVKKDVPFEIASPHLKIKGVVKANAKMSPDVVRAALRVAVENLER